MRSVAWKRAKYVGFSLAFVLLCPRAVHALELEVFGPEQMVACLDASALEHQIRSRQPGLTPEVTLRTSSVRSPPPGRAVTVRVRAGQINAERHVDFGAAACTEVRDALAIVAALLAQSVWDEAQAATRATAARETAARTVARPLPSPAEPSAPKAANPPSETEPRAVDEQGRGPALLFGLGAGVRTGLLPDIGAWPYATFGLRWPSRLSLELRAGAQLPQRHSALEGTLHFVGYSLALAGCAAPLSGLSGLSLCAEVQGGLVHGRAVGLELGNGARDQPTLRGAGRVAFDVELGAGAGRLGVWTDVGRAIVHPNFVVRDRLRRNVVSLASSKWGVGAGLGYSLFL